MMPVVPAQLSNGFWLGIGFALAFMIWSLIQMLARRGAEGLHG